MINSPANTVSLFSSMLAEVQTISPALVKMPKKVMISRITSQFPIVAAPCGNGRRLNFTNENLSTWIEVQFDTKAKMQAEGKAIPNRHKYENWITSSMQLFTVPSNSSFVWQGSRSSCCSIFQSMSLKGCSRGFSSTCFSLSLIQAITKGVITTQRNFTTLETKMTVIWFSKILKQSTILTIVFTPDSLEGCTVWIKQRSKFGK